MEKAVDMVADGRLSLTRIPAAEVSIADLNIHHARWHLHWQTCGVMGRQSLVLLPLGMWWMQQY